MQAFRRLALLARNGRKFSTSRVRMDEGPGGIPGDNLPFGINNHRKLALYFTLFIGTAFAAPFVVVRKQLLTM